SFWLTPEYGAPSEGDEMVSGVVYDVSGAVIDEFPIHRVDMSEGGGYVLYVPAALPGWYAVGQVGGCAIVYCATELPVCRACMGSVLNRSRPSDSQHFQ